MAGNRNSKRDPEKEATWVERLKQWERSGLGPGAYCRRHQYKQAQFYWWRRVLKERGRWIHQAKHHGSGEKLQEIPLAFTEVRVNTLPEVPEEREGHCNGKLEIWVGSRYRISVSDGFEAETLDRVLRILEIRPC